MFRDIHVIDLMRWTARYPRIFFQTHFYFMHATTYFFLLFVAPLAAELFCDILLFYLLKFTFSAVDIVTYSVVLFVVSHSDIFQTESNFCCCVYVYLCAFAAVSCESSFYFKRQVFMIYEFMHDHTIIIFSQWEMYWLST